MDISQITDSLFVGAQPAADETVCLEALGIRLIISMRGERRPPAAFSRPPLQVLWLRTFDTFFTPIPLARMMQGVQAALPVLAAGGRVLAHCHQGRHRGPAMGAAILIAQGYPAEAAMRLLRERRPAAQPQIWYVGRQVRGFERAWRLEAGG